MKSKFLLLIPATVFAYQVQSQPCEGPPALSEQFENGLPSGWTVLDLDGNTVYWSLAARGYTGAFQSFSFHGHKCVANVSRFSSPSTANDWLISPQITVGTAPACLSWQAASMYSFYPET